MPSFSRLSLTKQISSASILVILLTMFVLTTFVSVTGARTAIQTGHAELAQQAKSVQQMLEGYFKAVNLRAERQLNMLEQWMPGQITTTSNMVDTNGVLLPELRVGDMPVNANPQLLEEFKTLTGTEIAFLAVHQGRVYRASTLLKKDGKSMAGTEISADDPVTKSLLQSKDFSGLVFRAGKYYFLKTKVVLNAQGKAVAGLSLRVSLDVELEQMQQLFGGMKVGRTGGVSILRVGGQDNGGGEWMVHAQLQSKKLSEMESDSPWLNSTKRLLQDRPTEAEMDVSLSNGTKESVFVSTVESAPWEWLVIVSAPRAEFLAQAASTRNLIIFSGVLAALVCALVVYFLLRNRLKPLSEVVTVLRCVGGGDLTASVQHVLPHSENEIDMIGEAVNRTCQHMRHLIEGVDQACQELLSSSESLKRQADIAIDSASQQLDAVSSMSTGVEEMHVTVSQVAQNASDAANASEEVRQQTNKGRNMVAGTVTDMSSIASQVEQSAEVVESLGKNSQQILNIVEVIRDIADRTNLLALNAAIEAARAGESGRGFAVVADEVRKLAEQTSTSTQEISATVDSILAQTNLAVNKMSGVSRSVGEGATRAKQAGLALDAIDRQIESSVTWANDIAHSTGEQQVVTERFADTVLRIHELAQRNHGASQNSDLAAREMIDLSHRLKKVVQQFKLA